MTPGLISYHTRTPPKATQAHLRFVLAWLQKEYGDLLGGMFQGPLLRKNVMPRFLSRDWLCFWLIT